MPQMAPNWWTMILFTVIMIIMMINCINYFNFEYKIYFKTKTNKKNLLLKW